MLLLLDGSDPPERSVMFLVRFGADRMSSLIKQPMLVVMSFIDESTVLLVMSHRLVMFNMKMVLIEGLVFWTVQVDHRTRS